MFISIPNVLIMHQIFAKIQNETDFQEHFGHNYFSVVERIYDDEILILEILISATGV